MNVTIITIREASWLTDHTYTYDEVVKMMGELMAVFRGDLRVSVREGGCKVGGREGEGWMSRRGT